MFTFRLLLDMNRDIENWVYGANATSHGKDWKEGVRSEYQHVVDQLQGVPFQEAQRFMVPFLEGLYAEKKEMIDQKL